jgi:ABC-2 type transport system permease protein
VIDGLWVLWASMRLQVRDMRSSQPALVVSIVQPAVLLILTARSGRADGDVTARVVGVTLTALWAATIWAAGGILRREAFQGTLASSLTGVRPAVLVLAGKCLAATMVTAAMILGTTAVCVLSMRLPVRHQNLPWLAAGCLVVMLAGAALGALLACLFLISRHGLHLSSALMYPVFILGGMLIPPGVLPTVLRWPSWLLSFHWAGEFVVAAAGGRVRLGLFAAAVVLAAGYALAAHAAFTRVLRLARQRGTLELV